MIPIGLLLLAAGIVAAGAPWWVQGVVVLPAILWAPGVGWARWLNRAAPPGGLQLVLDAAWVGLGLSWCDVALLRELGLPPQGLWALSAVWSLLGLWAGRRTPARLHTPARELGGAAAVVLAVLAVAAWRSADIARPLDGYWWLTGADEEGHERLSIEPGAGWAEVTGVGWEEAGALRLRPERSELSLRSPEGAEGRLVVAVRGPLGVALSAGGQRAEVERSVAEAPEEGPVRRYLTRGTAGLALDVDLPPGGSLPLTLEGPATEVVVYVLPSTDAVWSLHAAGELRYAHYYQLLNQVENLDWAEEIWGPRRFVWNQPPGWTPILGVAYALINPDMPGGNILFLWVLLLVGLSSVRLASALAPGAAHPAWLIPAGMVGAHGLLMLEPASANFPDSLFAASVLGVAGALAAGRARATPAFGLAAQALRWPGGVLASLLALSWGLAHRVSPLPGLRRLWVGLLAGVGIAALLVYLGEAEDLAFILYFETFPEHWHDDYALGSLLPRIPEFYGAWARYTGGGLLLVVVGALFGAAGPVRTALRALFVPILAYSAILSTVDHSPSHYFLPLVGMTGPLVVAASATRASPVWRWGLSIACLLGLWIFLWTGQI